MRDSDIAYDKIKEMIMTAKLIPGQVIIESELMEELSMGRTPIREALNRLSWEEQVRTIPRKCIMVSEFPMNKMESIYQVRSALTTLEGELATTRRTEQEIENLKTIVENMRNEKAPDKRVMIERGFHRTISKMTKNFLLEKDMNNVTDLCIRFMFLNKQYLECVDDSVIEECEEIINSIVRGNVKNTIQLLQHHVSDFKKLFVK